MLNFISHLVLIFWKGLHRLYSYFVRATPCDTQEIDGWTVIITYEATREVKERIFVTSDQRDDDSENDGITNYDEIEGGFILGSVHLDYPYYYTNPTDWDTDGDGCCDGYKSPQKRLQYINEFGQGVEFGESSHNSDNDAPYLNPRIIEPSEFFYYTGNPRYLYEWW